MSGWDDVVHELLQRAEQQAGHRDFHLIGNCIEYKPENNMGRFVVTGYSSEDESGQVQPFETGWTKVESHLVGNGWGFQYCMKGGATTEQPEKGEEVRLSVVNAEDGMFSCSGLNYNDTMTPPGAGSASGDVTGDPDGTNKLKPSEFIWRHETGTFFKFYSDGSVQLNTQSDLNVVVQNGNLNATVDTGDVNVDAKLGTVNVTATKNVVVDATADVNVTAAAATVQADTVTVDATTSATVTSPAVTLGAGTPQVLCNEAFLEWANNHTHADPQGGQTTGPIVLAQVGVHTTVDTEAS